MEAYYDCRASATGRTRRRAKVLKAQHPEFETWSQGTHARAGVSRADCHMPYLREGAIKVSDHRVRSPMRQVNRSCQTCHHASEAEMTVRVQVIQGRHKGLMNRAEDALVQLYDTIKEAKVRGTTDEQLKEAFALQRKAQWRLDFSNAENSQGFHAPQESVHISARPSTTPDKGRSRCSSRGGCREASAAMNLEQSFLDSIRESPDDPVPWLILADWLEEREDPCAELVRLTRSLRTEPEHADFDSRQRRVQELLAGGMKPLVPTLTNSIEQYVTAPSSRT